MFDQVDKEWTLFLDRDGVINKWLPGEYVQHWGMFEFEYKSKEAIAKLSEIFGRIIIVTNQQGIHKGLMSPRDLDNVHDKMLDEIEELGGKIDRIYYCPFPDGHEDRKPSPGMVKKAQRDYPKIDFSKSIMVGDKNSDMQMAKAVDLISVMVADHEETVKEDLVDYKFQNLFDFSNQF